MKHTETLARLGNAEQSRLKAIAYWCEWQEMGRSLEQDAAVA
jgi:hypothetical protein